MITATMITTAFIMIRMLVRCFRLGLVRLRFVWRRLHANDGISVTRLGQKTD